jgi:hypothetical protein
MKKIFALLALSMALFTTSVQAQHQHTEESKATPSAVKGQVYGENIPEKKVVKGKDFVKKLDGENPVQMQVKGTVTGVCKARGCWITVDIGNDKEVFVKMKDYGFFMPMDAMGKEVLLSGEGFVETTSVEELKEKAKEKNKSEAEINAIKKPKENLRFTAHGITVLN